MFKILRSMLRSDNNQSVADRVLAGGVIPAREFVFAKGLFQLRNLDEFNAPLEPEIPVGG